jgi:hypothetical protein
MAVTLNASTSSGFIQTADTSGEINLQSNGSTKLSVLSTGVSGTLVQGTAVASTSGTSIDFTSIPSWVKRVTVNFQGVSTNSTSNLLLQIGSGSISNTGYESSSFSTNSTNAGSSAGYILTGFVAAASLYSGSAVINLVNSATNMWVVSSILGQGNSPSSQGGLSFGGGYKATSGTLDRIRITTVNGTDTFDAGTVNIQYEG